MSYLERLSQIRDNLKKSQNLFQEEQDAYTGVKGHAELLKSKISDVAERMEAVGSLGFGAIKSGQSVSKLIKKIREKRNQKEEKEEDKDKPKEEGEEETPAEAPEGSTSAEAPESLNGSGGSTASYRELQPPEPEDIEMNTFSNTVESGGNIAETEFPTEIEYELPEAPAEPEPTPEAQPSQAQTEETSFSTPEEQYELPSEHNAVQEGQGEAPAEPTEASDPIRAETRISTAGEQNASMPRSQQQVLDQDPEGHIADSSTDITNDAGVPSSSTGESGSSAGGAGDAGDIAPDIAPEAGGVFEDMGGMLTADAVLDAVPVVGEIAMIGTAIAGFFEALFGGGSSSPTKPKPPPPPSFTPSLGSVVSGIGVDANQLISKSKIGALV